MERRHRHLRQGRRPRRTPTSATRPTTPSGSTATQLRVKVVGEGGNLGVTQLGRIEAAPARRADQHRRHRQLRRCRHLRPRGQHQDPARRRSCATATLDRRAAQRAARRDDRRGRPRSCCATTTSRTSCSATPGRRRTRCSRCTSASSAGSRSAATSTARWSSCPTDAEIDAAGTRPARGSRRRSSRCSSPTRRSRSPTTCSRPRSPTSPWFAPGAARLLPAADRASASTSELDEPPAAPRDRHHRRSSTTMVNRGGITFAFRAREETGAAPGRDRPRLRRGPRGLRPAGLRGAGSRRSTTSCRRPRSPRCTSSSAGCSTARPAGCSPRRGGTVDVERRDRALPQRDRARLAPLVPDAAASASSASGCSSARRRARGARCARATSRCEAAALLDSFALLDIVEIAQATGSDAEDVARLYFALSERFEVDAMLTRITQLPRDDRWTRAGPGGAALRPLRRARVG